MCYGCAMGVLWVCYGCAMGVPCMFAVCCFLFMTSPSGVQGGPPYVCRPSWPQMLRVFPHLPPDLQPLKGTGPTPTPKNRAHHYSQQAMYYVWVAPRRWRGRSEPRARPGQGGRQRDTARRRRQERRTRTKLRHICSTTGVEPVPFRQVTEEILPVIAARVYV